MKRTVFEHLRPDNSRAAIVEGDRAVTFAELDELSRRWQGAFESQEAMPGDRIAAMLRPSIDAVAAMLGAYRARLRWVPINPKYPSPEVHHIALDARPCLAIADADLAPRFPPDVEVRSADAKGFALPEAIVPGAVPEPSDGALLIYTSGTTGRSKGVDLSHRAVNSAIGSLTDLWQWSSDDVLSLSLPLFHVHGLCIGIHGALQHGMTVRLHSAFAPADVVTDFEHGATVFMGVPTMYTRLLQHLDQRPSDAAALARGRLFTAGSAALPESVLRRFEDLTGHRILERYGMSETLLTLSNPYDGERRAGSVGEPIPGVEIRIVDDDGVDVGTGEAGELWVRAEGMMTGYFGQPEATRDAFRDGWFRTGDVVRRDDDGYVRIVGRMSTDIIKSGGFKIAAREIETVLAEDPDVEEVAVVGASDEVWGERVVAAVVASGSPVDEADWLERLQALATEHLADYKQPRQLLVLPELPRNALGKVLKKPLREMAEARSRS